MRLDTVFREGLRQLSTASPSPSLDAELLLMHVSGLSREKFHAYPELELSEEQCQKFFELVDRRLKHEPIAYILGVKEFWGLPFKVTPTVLIPRPETETIVEAAIKFLRSRKTAPNILDLGTGSGAIAVSLAVELKKSETPFSITAVDISEEALKIAAQNAATQGVLDCIHFVQSDWFLNLKPDIAQFDLIVTNPPYIALGDSEVSPELVFEPKLALYSGERGLDALKILLENLPRYLVMGGLFLSEVGSGQRPEIEQLLRHYLGDCYEVKFLRDLAGLERVLWVSSVKPTLDSIGPG